MELADALKEISDRLRQNKEVLRTEEAAKTAIILPFIRALGFDVFNPDEVVPEFVADAPGKKGEKVDYALKKEGKIAVLMECKICSTDLNIKHAAQLFRYFTMTDARLAVLTNGIVFQFFTDIDAPNKMDQRPFFIFSLEELNEGDIRQLAKFTKASFNIESIIENAGALKYRSLILQELRKEFVSPSDELVRFLTQRVYEGKLMPTVKAQFQQIVVQAMDVFVKDLVNQRLTTALQTNTSNADQSEKNIDPTSGVVTSESEVLGFRIVQAIAARSVDPKRVFMRDSKSYCAILLDDNNRRTICRLHFNSETNLQIGVFAGKEESRYKVAEPVDIYQYTPVIEAQIGFLTSASAADTPEPPTDQI
jgi:predicted type IV restriction endonuclease